MEHTQNTANYWQELHEAVERDTEADDDRYGVDQASTLGGHYYYTELER